MNTDSEMLDTVTQAYTPSETPSADFIHAISEFLDTNPDDLLLELGYYSRETAGESSKTTFASSVSQ